MRLLWAGLAIQLLGSAPVLVTGGGTKFTKPQVRLTTTFADFNARIMDHWEAEEGGAKRNEIRGTRAFGSGYPYGVSNQTTIARRPFPFGVSPLYWDQNFMDVDEYGPQYDAIRLGGFIASVPLGTTTQQFNVMSDEMYYA
ncbi:hypothetical protein FRB91_001821, partial [Serendipita sp. 411]